mmetsp:Transcript_31064/g.56491  ORF Transcript_31064/g.56491 Transcript_31064/m.56491 type:complete len:371 (+) Transcript_31064:93-1205(+)
MAAIEEPHVIGLYTYPIKSCQGVKLERAVLTPYGLGWAGENGSTTPPLDRQWCIVCLDEDAEVGDGVGNDVLRGFVQDIRVQPKLAAVHTSLAMHNEMGLPTAIEAQTPLCPELSPLILPINESDYLNNEQIAVNDRHQHAWFGRPVIARCAGEVAANWATRYLHAMNQLSQRAGERFRVVRFCGASPDESERRIQESFQGQSVIASRARPGDRIAFADCAPMHVLTLESLADLRHRLPTHAAEYADVHRFRANILVSGCRAPYVEDGWLRVRLAGALLRQLDSTGRCEIPTTDPNEGKKSEDSEPRSTLMSYRPMPYGAGPHGGPTFGIWMATDGVAKEGAEGSKKNAQGVAIVSINDTLRPVGPMARL